jgi:nucleotide-binding universal stress UspA family protein
MSINRIAVGLDGSQQSAAALAWAADLALATGADIIAVHAVDLAPYFTDQPGIPYIADPGAVADALLGEMEESWCRALRDKGVVYRSLVREGTAGPELLRAASEESADLIVVGSRARSALREAMLGSVAHYVTHHASCPVVVVPTRAAVAAEPASSSAMAT